MKTGVFIIESLDLEDEVNELFEGKIITQMLKMLGVEVYYTYIRTKKELKVMIDRYENSNYKYLHISCHGTKKGIGMTLDADVIPYSKFSNMFSYEGNNQRLFLSSCSALKGDYALEGLHDTQFLSVTGPLNNIAFSDAVVFWSSFYHLMFKKSIKRMENDHFKDTLNKLSSTFNLNMCTLIRVGQNYNRHEFKYKKQKDLQLS
ncbi:hypothetical protein ACIQZI_12535 [Peribacillus sp. NPDC096379]|uniref:hypothetical protein n=1 Tax=Peribacillus sp. NPDC096379 TaxID=3364393 RepID=UPI00380DC665